MLVTQPIRCPFDRDLTLTVNASPMRKARSGWPSWTPPPASRSMATVWMIVLRS